MTQILAMDSADPRLMTQTTHYKHQGGEGAGSAEEGGRGDLCAKSSIVLCALSECFQAAIQPLLHCQHLLTQLSSSRSS